MRNGSSERQFYGGGERLRNSPLRPFSSLTAEAPALTLTKCLSCGRYVLWLVSKVLKVLALLGENAEGTRKSGTCHPGVIASEI